jgi:hypothetical protein
MTLEELRAAVAAGGAGGACTLDAGTYTVTESIVVGRSGVEIRGAGEGATTLVRGKLADGGLFKGPLVSIVGQRDVSLHGFAIDGGRFERAAFGTLDHRHPLNADPAAPEFPCASRLPAPQCLDPRNFGSDVEADLYIFDTNVAQVRSISIRNSMTHGIAIGPGCRGVRLERMRLARCGQFGLWVGAALPGRLPLPLPPEVSARLPSAIAVVGSRFTRCGSAAIFLEGRDAAIEGCTFDTNHCDFPFNESGGQLEIDYKCEGVRVQDCRFEGRAFVRRKVGPDQRPQEYGAVAIEACGDSLQFIDNVVTGLAREALHLNGARRVSIAGSRTLLARNNLGASRLGWWPRRAPGGGNISITTTSEMAHLGAMARDIAVDSVRSENGIVVWSNGSVPGLKVDGVRVAASDLSGPRGRGGGVSVGHNPDGSSVRGEGWEIL